MKWSIAEAKDTQSKHRWSTIEKRVSKHYDKESSIKLKLKRARRDYIKRQFLSNSKKRQFLSNSKKRLV